MDAAAKRIAPQAPCYQRRRPEKTLWYRTVQTHFETWLALNGDPGDESTSAYIEQAFRRYLDCGILANGFARAHCDECGHDFLIAFSCKGRGVCPSCNTRRMAETAAHLTDHVFPRLPVRQWVLSVPKRLRYFLQTDAALQGAVLRIFSLDASVCIGGSDRSGLERLLRYCARPPFTLEHLQQLDAEHLVYHSHKPRLDGSSDLVLTPLELIDKIAALVPPPRSHRHRYYGVLAPNASLRAAVTAMAPVPVIALPPAASANTEEEPRHRAASRYLWAMLLARIYEAFPLACPICHSQMRIIAFIDDANTVRKILDHIGESTQPPRIAPARGPPLWEAAMAHRQAGNDPQWDMVAQPVPEFEFDQRIAW